MLEQYFAIGLLCVSSIALVLVLFFWFRSLIKTNRESRDSNKRTVMEQVETLHEHRLQDLAKCESLMEQFELEEQKRRSDRVAEHRREVTRIGHEHPEERTRLLAAHGEELASLDQEIVNRRAACLARLELESRLELCFRAWDRASWQRSVTSWQPTAEERRDLLEQQLERLAQGPRRASGRVRVPARAA